ncbi:MAG TPA: hypothetical protein VK659_24465 [Asanoa sp.]|nr:hypothetical protein [Asanoa sp.]
MIFPAPGTPRVWMLASRAGYLAVLLGNTATFLLAAVVVSRAAAVDRVAPPAGGSRLAALRYRPFMAFVLVDGLVAAALLVNTIGCVTLQVWISRGTHTAVDAVPVSRRGALLVGASCVLFGLTAGRSARLVGVLVLTAAVMHVIGQLWLSAGTFAVVFDLAPDWAQGQYQGALQTGRQIGDMLAPPLLAALVIGLGEPGWLALAAIFAAAALVYPPIVRWALRRRSALAETTPPPALVAG